MDKHPAIWLAALTPAACLPQKAAQPVPLPSPQAQTAAAEKRADVFQADEAKIARNMAAWDKLMALTEQQYPSFKALRKRQKAEPYANVEATIDHKKTDREFPKYAVPLGQLMSVSDKNIKAIEVYYA